MAFDETLLLNSLNFSDSRMFDRELTPRKFSYGSEICRADHFIRPNYTWWCEALGEKPRFHRKQWEWVFCCAALAERGMLVPGRRGLGFGVGSEPLSDAFTKFGVQVVGTDQAADAAVLNGWAATGEHAHGKQQMGQRCLTNKEDFERLASFQIVDMNAIPNNLLGFDFCWSSCCFEHLGSLRKGMDFVLSSMKTLAPGGVAVHTTEFNLSSDQDTLEVENLSLYRRSDILELVSELRSVGYIVEPLNFHAGAHPLERYVDLPPYNLDAHIRTLLEGYVCTSIGIIVMVPD